MLKLNDATIGALTVPPGKKDRLVRDAGMPGLYIRVLSSGGRRFVYQWTDPVTKRNQRDTLGAWPALTLAAARDAARVRSGDVARGKNPIAERKIAKAADDLQRAELALTLDKLVKDWAALWLKNRRAGYRAEAQRAIRMAFADVLNLPAAHINRLIIMARLNRMVREGKATTAGRTLAYARAAYSWALKQELVSTNPFSGLPVAVPNEERDRVLTEGELREIWAAAGQLSEPFGAFYRLALLTLARRNEVAGMRWAELSPDGTTWHLPGIRSKNGAAHTIHLSQPARDVLAGVKRIGDAGLVFTTTGTTPVSGFSTSKRLLDAKIHAARVEQDQAALPMPQWVMHDFRRGVSTLAGLGFNVAALDKLLNHKPSSIRGAGRAYQHHDFAEQRAAALDAWATIVTGAEPAGNVVAMKRAG